MIFNKGDIQLEKEQSFQQMLLGYLEFHMQTPEVGSVPHINRKTNSKFIKELNVSAKTIKLLDANADLIFMT